jgi:putative exosortase-associated protein (TIGR04073 family)
MHKSLNFAGLAPLLAVAVLMLAGATAGAQEPPPAPTPAPAPAPLSAGGNFSAAACASQAGRGLANITCCWLELPYQIKTHLEDQKEERPTTVFVPLYDFVAGTVHGTVATAERLVGGTIEVITSPIPTYGPLMNPPYPPFLFTGPRPVAAAPAAPQPPAAPEAPEPPPAPTPAP